MTIKDLYEYAVKKGLENSEVKIQYADSGGFYYGTRDLKENEIYIEEKSYGKVVVL